MSLSKPMDVIDKSYKILDYFVICPFSMHNKFVMFYSTGPTKLINAVIVTVS
jgi:hypothetical protein